MPLVLIAALTSVALTVRAAMDGRPAECALCALLALAGLVVMLLGAMA